MLSKHAPWGSAGRPAVSKVNWLRYGEWLMTCPVLLIALSNLTGLKDDYSVRTMRLLTGDQARGQAAASQLRNCLRAAHAAGRRARARRAAGPQM